MARTLSRLLVATGGALLALTLLFALLVWSVDPTLGFVTNAFRFLRALVELAAAVLGWLATLIESALDSA